MYEAATYREQGYYQCAVFTEEYMSKEVRSQKVEVQFQGLYYLKTCGLIDFLMPF